MQTYVFMLIGIILQVTDLSVRGIPVSSINCGDISTAVPGSPYTLTCTWSGSLSSGVKWRKDGVNVMVCNAVGLCIPATSGYASGTYPNSTSATLTITSFNSTIDSGLWECRDGADPTVSCTLPSIAPPSKPTMTIPGSLCEGKTISLTCSSSDPGNPPATYYWTKNTVSMATGSPYTFTPGRDDHQAQIRCEAGNDHTDRSGHSRPQSDVRQLNVYYIPRLTISPASDQTRKEGQSLSFTCSADSNPDNAVLSWTYNGSTLTGVSVKKTNLSRSDHGVYTCTGRVNTGSVCPGGFLQGQRNTSVIVNYSPDLILTNVTETETQTATVRCQADGRPDNFNFSPFVHTWRGHVIRHVTGEKDRKIYQKVFASSSYQDSGVYVCEVGNGVPDRQGVTQHKGNISAQINASPKMTADIDEESIVGVEVGENTTLFRTFYSKTSITSYTWSKEGQTLNNTLVSDTTVQLDIYGVTVDDDGYNFTLNIGPFDKDTDPGRYNLQVCNSVGCESSSITLTTAEPPFTPTQFQILENTTTTSVWLSWKPNFPGNYHNQKFIVEYRMQGGQWKELGPFIDTEEDVMVVEVNSLSPGTLYEFRVYAKNTRETNNRSKYTDILQVVTKVEDLQTSQQSLLGPVVGYISAVVAFIAIIVLIVIIIYRKCCRCSVANTKQDNRVGGQGQDADNMAYSSVGPGENRAHATYASLENKTSPDYTELRLYENSKGPGENQAHGTYAGLENRSSPDYTGLRLYENSKGTVHEGNQTYDGLQERTPVPVKVYI